ncbi:response regulator [Muricoccus pecuniae]|uniref:CheY-like chemotaxis protein n=1 Tax=Muricoccus pecuniae TaxID=693023 RepID=A0A840YM55_9PROT|nr:response regulator [Roseomonas pecuniae]MBB5696342.1 CheY-like chemotaxis protein [Roseomonas pecuniae]
MCDVLVVEDQAIVRMVLVDMLEDEGLAVREAATPEDALRFMEGPAGCSVLVTDIDLGVAGMDGFVVAARGRHHTPDLSVLFLSGRPSHFNGRSYSEKERTLIKPFRREELLTAVRALLSH